MGLFDTYTDWAFKKPFDFITGRGGKDPAHEAGKYLDQIPGVSHGIYDPYIQHGKDAYNTFNPITSSMTTDPAGFLENIMKNYSTSRGFKLKNDQMTQAAGNTAAAGGMRGSMGDIGNQAHITDMLMGDDMQQWLQNVMGIQGRGLQSQEHLYDTGFDASKNLGSDLTNTLGSKATLGYQGALQGNKSHSDMVSALMKLIGGGAGFMAGGPGGAAIGSQVGGSLGNFF